MVLFDRQSLYTITTPGLLKKGGDELGYKKKRMVIDFRKLDRANTAFSDNNGKYEFCRLPFDLKTPQAYVKRKHDVLTENN